MRLSPSVFGGLPVTSRTIKEAVAERKYCSEVAEFAFNYWNRKGGVGACFLHDRRRGSTLGVPLKVSQLIDVYVCTMHIPMYFYYGYQNIQQ